MSPILQNIVPGLRRLLSTRREAPAAGGALKPARDRLRQYLRGNGIEIGALHNPMPVNRGARVRYVDHLPLAEQRRHYPELSHYPLVEPDIIADAASLRILEEGSQDFIIANHVIEQLPDPIAALKEWYRVLRSGGILFLAVPDKRVTFDKDRPRTTLGHLIADHDDGGAASRTGHYEEYSRLVHGKQRQELTRDVATMLARNYSIHLHVWIPEDIAQLLEYVDREHGLRWQIAEFVDSKGTDEFIYILQKL